MSDTYPKCVTCFWNSTDWPDNEGPSCEAKSGTGRMEFPKAIECDGYISGTRAAFSFVGEVYTSRAAIEKFKRLFAELERGKVHLLTCDFCTTSVPVEDAEGAEEEARETMRQHQAQCPKHPAVIENVLLTKRIAKLERERMRKKP